MWRSHHTEGETHFNWAKPSQAGVGKHVATQTQKPKGRASDYLVSRESGMCRLVPNPFL